jgi:hypothetical protein
MAWKRASQLIRPLDKQFRGPETRPWLEIHQTYVDSWKVLYPTVPTTIEPNIKRALKRTRDINN